MRNRAISSVMFLTLLVGALSTAGAQRGGMMWGGGSPLQSNTMGLLMRPEVQTELRLDVGQKRALAELMQTSRAEMQQRMRQNFQGLRNQPREERRAQMEQMRTQMREQMAAFQGEINKKVEEILSPKQVKRLHELDLQLRGPLALADPKTAEKVGISAESRAAIAKINMDYQTESRQVTQQFFEQMRADGGFQRGPQGFNWQAAMAPMRQKMQALRKAAEEKAVAQLTAEEKTRWKAAQGEKFRGWRDVPGAPGGRFF